MARARGPAAGVQGPPSLRGQAPGRALPTRRQKAKHQRNPAVGVPCLEAEADSDGGPRHNRRGASHWHSDCGRGSVQHEGRLPVTEWAGADQVQVGLGAFKSAFGRIAGRARPRQTDYRLVPLRPVNSLWLPANFFFFKLMRIYL